MLLLCVVSLTGSTPGGQVLEPRRLAAKAAARRKAALLADVVFAKDGLANWCSTNNLEFLPFEGLRDVQQALLGTQG